MDVWLLPQSLPRHAGGGCPRRTLSWAPSLPSVSQPCGTQLSGFSTKKSVWGGRRGQHKGRQPGVSHISTDGHVKTHAGRSLTQVSTDGVPGAVADSHFGHVELCAGYAGLPPGGPAASAPSAPGRGGAETGSTPAVCGDVCCHPPTSCGVSVPDGAPCMPGPF